MRILRTCAVFAAMLLSHSVWGQACPAVPHNQKAMDRKYADLRAAPSEMHARVINDQIWMSWTKAPDATAQDLLDRGRERIRVADYAKAVEHFSALIDYCPDYAEGWNQRGFVHYLKQNYSASLSDIAEALEREPRHYGALAGRATVLISMGRTEIGLTALREALKLNPWLSERHLLPPDEDI